MDKRKRQKLRNMKWGKILVTYFLKLLEKSEANRIMQSIVNRESDIVDNLIKEIEKPFTKLSTNNTNNTNKNDNESNALINSIPLNNKHGRKRFSIMRSYDSNYLKCETRNINVKIKIIYKINFLYLLIHFLFCVFILFLKSISNKKYFLFKKKK